MRTGEAMQIGAGNIGLGFIGEVMHEAGMHVTFADVDEQRIQNINDEGGYPIHEVSVDGSKESYIDDISAISSRDETAMMEHIVNADIITTAVGANVLPRLAPVLARGLMERLNRRPDDSLHVAVVACENMDRNTETLRDLIMAELPDDEWRGKILGVVSFPNSAVDRIVPNSQADLGHPLAVLTEDYYQLAIDRKALLEPIPEIPSIQLVDNLDAVLTQKLFTLNGAHAAAAYWGYLGGHETIDTAMSDPNIQALVKGLMTEVGGVIVREFPSITPDAQQTFADKIIRRFRNPHLHDQPQRVGRQPIRKLGSRDRLLGPALMAMAQGESPANLTMAIVGGFRFDSPEDQQAVEIHQQIERDGIDPTVAAVTGLNQGHPLVRHTVAGYRVVELTA